MLQLYNRHKEKVNGLTKYKDYYIESVLSTGDKTLSFSYPANLRDLIEEEGYIRNKTDEFVIKEIQDSGNYKTIKAVLNVEDLEGKVWDRFVSTEEKIADCLALALAGTDWIVGTCDITKKRTVVKTGCSTWAIIQEAQKTYRVELEFDTLNKKINVNDRLGTDKGCYFIESLNLKALDIQGNSYDYYTRIVAEGKDGLLLANPGYVENYQYSNKVKTFYWKDERYTDIESLTEDATAKLEEMSKPYRSYTATICDLANMNEIYKDILSYRLGDIIAIISKKKSVKEKQRIVKITEYPDEPNRNTCEISNTKLSFDEIQKQQQETTDTVNNITEDDGTISESAISTAVAHLVADKADIQDLQAVTARIGTLEVNKANIDDLTAYVANINSALISKANITDLQAINAEIKNLDAAIANINIALIYCAKIDDLAVTNETVTNLAATSATITQLNATNANVATLTTTTANINNALISKANVADLTATNATISTLNTDVANIKTLVNGNLTSSNIQSLVLTSSKVTVDNGFIKNAMIENLDVAKINAGTLNTNKISVASGDGSLVIAGATQQFKDSNKKVRLQLGQDAQGNFNFILVASDGTTTLIDGTGVHEKAIADKLIKTNMVADQAITSQQINYSSFVTGLNADTNTSYIKASKVAIDLTGQTLDIAFNNMNTTVTSVQSTATTATTTANSASSTASSALSKANTAITTSNTANTTATNANATANTANSTATTASTNASNAVSTANTANSTANSALSTANTASTNANNAVATVNNLQIGGRNLLYNSGDFKNITNWNIPSSAFRYTINADNTLTITKSANVSAIHYGVTLTQKFTANQQYTISIYAKSSVSGNIGFSLEKSTGEFLTGIGFNFPLADTYYLLTQTFTTASGDVDAVRFSRSSSSDSLNQSLTFKYLKLEIGNKFTDWTSCPEDIDSAITSVKTVTETNTTSISAIQGQISTLISNTTITATNGTVTQLKDAYNGTVNTINSMKTTIGEHTTDIDANTTNITSVTAKAATLETNLNSISATLTSTSNTVATHTTQISTANTNITTALNNASTAVTTANNATTTANTAKTTATTASTDATSAKTTATTASTNASTALTNSNTAISTANSANTSATNAVNTANKASANVATLTTTVTNTTSRVASLELTTSGLTTTVSNVQTSIATLDVGGRNFLKDSSGNLGSGLGGGLDTGYLGNKAFVNSRSGYSGSSRQLYGRGVILPVTTAGSYYTLSFYLYICTDIALDSNGGSIFVRCYQNGSTTVYQDLCATGYATNTATGTWLYMSTTDKLNFDVDINNCNFNIALAMNGHIKVSMVKFEKGTKATSWTPAPEDVDSSIATVQNYATTTINSAVSTINQTTDGIKVDVSNLKSSVTTINTTLGNKADTTTVTNISNTVASLQTSVNSINANITSLNSNVTTVTTTANNAYNAINNLQIGGRNLALGTATAKTVTGTGGTNQTWHIYNVDYSKVVGEQVTISFDVVSTASSGIITIQWNAYPWGSLSAGSITASTTTKHITVTSTQPSTGSPTALGIRLDNITGTVTISNLKLELGNQATDWTVAPEDVDSSISAVNTNATNAISTANNANLTANTASNNASTALTNANNAVSTANAANTTATTSNTNANSALSTANSASNTANTANTNANNAISTANKASSDVVKLTTTVSSVTNRVTSLELTASGLTTRVENTETTLENLEIGGRNLLYNSGNFTSLTHWNTYITNFYATISNNEMVITRTGTVTGVHLTQDMVVDLVKGRVYTLSMDAKSNLAMNFVPGLKFVSDQSCSQFSNATGNFNFITANEYEKLYVTFTHTADTGRYMLWWSSSGRPEFVVNIRDIKLEVGNKVTDYTPAIEDVNQNIADVKTYATTTINSNVATINQTTDSIKANVTSLQSSVSTINTTLGKKADTTTVTAISNRTATLETSLTGINASITTINSNVSSVTTTANNAYNAINSLQIGGRNRALGTATSKTGTGFTGTTNYCPSMYTVLTSGLVGNKSVTVSFDFIYTGLTKNSGGGLWIQGNGDVTGWTTQWNNYNFTSLLDWTNGSGSLKVQYTFTISATQMTNSKFYLAIRTDYITGGSFTVSNFKVEQGNTKTDWTPAPEDTDSQITTINTSVSSLQSSVSVLQSQIALKVEQTNIDTAVSTLNGKIATTNSNISSLQSSINLQLSSITSKVSQTVSTKNLLKNASFDESLVINYLSGTFTNVKVATFKDAASWLSFSGPKLSDNVLFMEVGSSGDWYAEIKNLDVKLTAGKTYTLSYYHCERGNWGNGSSFIYFYDSNGVVDFNKVINTSYYGNPSQWDWARYSTTFTVPDGMVGAYLRFGMRTTGYAWTIIDNVQIEEGSSVTDYTTGVNSAVGSIITQSPTQVMTAFNNISNYFQISPDGAKFGNISSGDYTLMSSSGMQHHIGGTNYNYMYVVRAISFSYHYVAHGTDYADVAVNFDADTITLLNGKVPTAVVVNLKFSPESGWGVSAGGDVYVSNVTATGVTLKALVYTNSISVNTSTYVEGNYSTDPITFQTTCTGVGTASSASTVAYNMAYTGSVNGSILVLA